MKYALLIPASVVTILFSVAIWIACTAFGNPERFQPPSADSTTSISHQTLLGHTPLELP
jgi:hypothetical protein